MLEYAEKLTLAPALIREEDLQKLRDAGWTDTDILDIAGVCAYFNFRVRMVDGLGLKMTEGGWERAQLGREKAAHLAKERDIEMPEDLWGLEEHSKASAG